MLTFNTPKPYSINGENRTKIRLAVLEISCNIQTLTVKFYFILRIYIDTQYNTYNTIPYLFIEFS